MSAGFFAVMASFLFVMIRDNLTGWDLVIPVVGAVNALLWLSVMQPWYRAQTRREHSFGESLRDQLNRHIALLKELDE